MPSVGPRVPRLEANTITGPRSDYDGLLEPIGDRGLVLLGEPPETYPAAI